MTELLHDLWPVGLLTSRVVTPLSILQFQAALVKDRSGGVLEGQIRTSIVRNGQQNRFLLIAPLLDGYECELLSVWHEFNHVYPAFVYWNGAPRSDQYDSDPSEVANSQDEFEQIIKKVFNATDTLSIVQSLLAQSNDKMSQTEAVGVPS